MRPISFRAKLRALIAIKIRTSLVEFLSRFGLFFSKQPKKYDLLKEQIRFNLLKNKVGVLHIGAHFGQECEEYENHNLRVIWIEAAEIPFLKLQQNISNFANQEAIKALLGNSNVKTRFFTSNNDSSSSIYRFGQDMPHEHLSMIGENELQMIRLDSIFTYDKLKDFKYWAIDVQGAEYLVLEGAGDLLKIPNVIEIEISTREEYEGGAKYEEIDDLLSQHGFQSLWNPAPHSHENIYYVKLAK